MDRRSRIAVLVTCSLAAGCFAAAPLLAAVPPGAPASAAAQVEVAADDTVVETPHPERFKVVKVSTKAIEKRVTTNGSVSWDVTKAVPVSSMSAGRAVEVKVRLGDDVKKDQLLLVIDSQDMAQAQSDYRKATSAKRLAERTLARAKLLYAHEAGPLKDVQSAEDTVNQTSSDVTSAAEKIRLMGSTPGSRSSLIEIHSPVDGTIVEQNVQRGAPIKSLDNQPNLFTVADLSAVWILCDLYENNLSDVSVGDKAKITLNAYPDKKLWATVTHISRVLDPATRTAKVRLELANADAMLRPNMFAKVKFISAQSNPSPMVPAGAILNLHDKSWVFKRESENKFRRVEVSPGVALPEGITEVHGGVQVGDDVIENAIQFSTAGDSGDSK